MTDQTVIVGAGPGGLAVAAMLGEHGTPYPLLERANSVGSSWRGRYDSLHLHTARWLSALPGASIPKRSGLWVSRDDLVAYLDDYASRFQIAPEFGVEVTRIARNPAGWRVETSEGTRLARTVVIATGYGRTPTVPIGRASRHFRGRSVIRRPIGSRRAIAISGFSSSVPVTPPRRSRSS